MSIDTVKRNKGAPAERNVSGNGNARQAPFRSSGARRNLLEPARSIDISSLRDEEGGPKKLVKKTRSWWAAIQ
jgi:hypothetical protein